MTKEGEELAEHIRCLLRLERPKGIDALCAVEEVLYAALAAVNLMRNLDDKSLSQEAGLEFIETCTFAWNAAVKHVVESGEERH